MTSMIHPQQPTAARCFEDAQTESATLLSVFPELLPQDLTLEESAEESQPTQVSPDKGERDNAEAGWPLHRVSMDGDMAATRILRQFLSSFNVFISKIGTIHKGCWKDLVQ